VAPPDLDSDATVKHAEVLTALIGLGGGESRRALRVRALAAVRALEQRFDGEPIVVVTHLGWLRALAPGLELPNAGTLWLDSAALGGEGAAGWPEESL